MLKTSMSLEIRTVIDEIIKASLDAADPYYAVSRAISIKGDILNVLDNEYDLCRISNIYVVGAGKAGGSMASAISDIFGDRIKDGTVNVKYGHALQVKRIRITEGGHPIPDQNSLSAVSGICSILKRADRSDLIIALISGGGSALLPLPAEGISLDDKKWITDIMLKSGASIDEINVIRRHISKIKGGQLARMAYPARIISLILSDVVGDPMEIIASGPTTPDSSTYQDAIDILRRYNMWEKMPDPVQEHLIAGNTGNIMETPKPGDSIFDNVDNFIIGNNKIAAKKAADAAEKLGFNTMILSTFIKGEVKDVAKVMSAIAKEIHYFNQPVHKKACIIAGGETTVTVKGKGKGGRCQEFVLSSAIEIAGLKDTVILAFGTDGTDGPTDAAGAVADGTTLERAKKIGLAAEIFLANNDSYTFFNHLGDLIITGPTRTNVNDLYLILSL